MNRTPKWWFIVLKDKFAPEKVRKWNKFFMWQDYSLPAKIAYEYKHEKGFSEQM